MTHLNEQAVIRRLRGIVRRNNWSVQKLAAETGVSIHNVRHLRHDYFSTTPELLNIFEIFVRNYEEHVEGVKTSDRDSCPGHQIICSLDTQHYDRAETLSRELYRTVGGIKLGTDFLIFNTIDDVRRLAVQVPESKLFLDFNLYGFPHQIQRTIETIMPLKADFITLNTGGGQKMLRYARRTAERYAEEHGIARPKLLGTTLLTSLDENDAKEMGIDTPLSDHILHLARMAEECGMDGVVCSGNDIPRLRSELGQEMVLVGAGIRPLGFTPPKDEDQKRICGAVDALNNGADYIIIGRPITASPYPLVAANQIVNRLIVNSRLKQSQTQTQTAETA